MKNPVMLFFLFCCALAGCATAPLPAPAGLFDDAAFGAPSRPVDPARVFALSEPMRQYLRTEIAGRARAKGPRLALFEALYSRGQLKLEYDAAQTRDAAQSFEARAGNCLSLVIMTAALAKEMGLEVEYRTVLVDDSWSRSGDLYFVSGHVNLVLGRRRTDPFTAYGAEADLAIDFLPPADSAGYRTVSILERTIVAMYMNNRAAETLAQDHLDDAYWWARGAIAQDPGFSASYNTLGVIFRRHGQLEAARRAFAFALERAPTDTGSMHNLAQALTALGEDAQADVLRRKLAQLQPQPPFHFFELGRAAMESGDFRAAVALFSTEIERDPYYHEFHFWLAQAYFRLGQVDQAERQLTLAMEASGASAERALYAAKLDRLRALTPH